MNDISSPARYDLLIWQIKMVGVHDESTRNVSGPVFSMANKVCPA